jgi:MFS family permease
MSPSWGATEEYFMPIWLRLSIAGGATLLVGMGIGRFSYSPMIPALIEADALTASQAGSVGAANFVGYLAGALAAPLMRRQWGEATTLRLSLLVALAALGASILPWGFIWLMFWRGLVGACVGVMMIYCLAIATRYAPPGKLGAATGITYTGVGIGILLAGTLVPWLLMLWTAPPPASRCAMEVFYNRQEGSRPRWKLARLVWISRRPFFRFMELMRWGRRSLFVS